MAGFVGKFSSLAALTALGLTVSSSCTCGDKKPDKAEAKKLAAAQGLADAPSGLQFRLAEGSLAGRAGSRNKVADAKKLSSAATESLLARLPAFEGSAGDQTTFAFRERSKPAPRTGETITSVFPSAGGPPPAAAATSDALEVRRFSPEGDVPIAPHLSVTFSQPMVAVTSHADNAQNIPVTLRPQPKGKWRWVGTKTLLFDPEIRFPQATKYEVEVAKGTKGLTGEPLAKAVKWTFQTPPLTVKRVEPHDGPHDLEPVIAIEFDQRINEKELIRHVVLDYNSEKYPVQKATDAEIAADSIVQSMVEIAEKDETRDRLLVVKGKQPISKASTVYVKVRQGAPSAEGTRLTQSDQLNTFSTYAPLKIVSSRCHWGDRCPPRSGWQIEMNNPLDPEKLEPSAFEITPKLKGRQISVRGKYIRIRGLPAGNTSYAVSVPATLTDKFGQTLGVDKTRTFDVGPAQPQLSGPSGLVILDPYADTQKLNVFSIGQKELKVSLYKVEPADWDAFAHYMYRWRDKTPPAMPGKRVFSENIAATAGDGELVETGIDLSPALDAGLGHVVAIVEPTEWPSDYKPRVQVWVQSTKLGIDATVDRTTMRAFATELATGAPAADVELKVLPHDIVGKSAKDGTAVLPLRGTDKKGRHLLVARRGKDVAFLPDRASWWSDRGLWFPRPPGVGLRWMVFDDRSMYRPGEEVRLKGWIRARRQGVGGDIERAEGLRNISYVVRGPRGNEITKGRTAINAIGGFDLRFKLPGTPNLGNARVEFSADGAPQTGATYNHRFQIQEFRRPEYEVSAVASPGPHTIGGKASVTASATYYAGGGLPAAPITWSVSASPTSFSPPGHEKFTFGTWVPWWSYDRSSSGTASQQLNGTTTSAGKHVLDIDFLSAKPATPMSVTANARVSDVNRQSWSASANLLVHPSELYVGIRRDKYFVDQGNPIEFDLIVSNQDGEVKTGIAIEAKVVRIDWKWKRGRYEETEADPKTCQKTSAAEAVSCKVATTVGGTYKVSATVVDSEGRTNQSSVRTWVSGGKRPPARSIELEKVELVPDQEEYRPGDSARLLVQAPFDDAEGIVTVRRSGIVSSERFTFKGPSHVLDIPIRAGDTPNLTVQVEVVGKNQRVGPDGKPAPKLPPRPAFATGQINLKIPPLHRTLTIEAKPAARKLSPGGETTVSVLVRDASGKPVQGAEVAVVVVDESVLALSGKKTPDPASVFYGSRGAGASDHRSRAFAVLARPDAADLAQNGQEAPEDADNLEESGAMPATPSPDPVATPGRASGQYAMKKESAAPELRRKEADNKPRRSAAREKRQTSPNTPIAVRSNFDALATFVPEAATDASGLVAVPVVLPDNLTRYRVMAVAVDGTNQFGSGESSITARLPLMVRPSPPRFLNFGDEFDLPIVVQNQTDEPVEVSVALRTANATLTAGGGRLLTVPANDRLEVRFPTKAMLPGTARFQVGVTAGDFADAKTFSLPVWTPATTEAFATYGSVGGKGGGAVVQPVARPTGVVPEFGGLNITTSSTQLQALTDAVLYLYRYPYECAEQLSSRVLAIAALRDVLGAFESDGLPNAAALETSMKADMKRIGNVQNPNGGFGFWTYRSTWPYLSVHVTHALARAKAKGYPVPAQTLTRAQAHIARIENWIPAFYSQQARETIIAYSLYVRKLLGDVDVAKAKGLLSSSGTSKLSAEALGWLLYTLAKDPGSSGEVGRIIRHFENNATETASTATFATSMTDGAHLILHSSRRADAIVLEALLEAKPKHDLIEKVVRGLLAHRKRGKWQNTQENVFVLLAMDRYFAVYEKETPNFVARAWLGDKYAGDHRFRGRTTERHRIEVPMSLIGDSQNLTFAREGAGRMYYRVGMQYAPADLKMPAADHGFAVERIYEAVDDPSDVKRAADGSWQIKAGSRVRVRVTMAAESRRYHVALVDPLPAGLEPLNPALKVTGELPADPKANAKGNYWWWNRTWYEHQNMRDERVEAFASLLYAGVHEYTYMAAATTPGVFVAPPPKAEEMYAPETFGRGPSDRVIVE